jgi:hypothetical protein
VSLGIGRTRKVQPGEHIHEVHRQPHRFVGLYLAPLLALPFAWLIHVWAFGITWHGRHYGGSPVLGSITLIFLGFAMYRMIGFASKVTAHRDQHLQETFTATVALLGVLFVWNVGTGPQYVVSGAFWIVAWLAATMWTFPRLDVARKDAREDGEQKDGFWKKIGVSAATKIRGRITHDEKTGEPLRLDLDFDHDRESGETIEVLAEALPAIESAAGGPRGLSTVNPVGGRADKSHATVPLVDPFRSYIPLGKLTAPGGSIGEFVSISDYMDGEPAKLAIAGGLVVPTSTSHRGHRA